MLTGSLFLPGVLPRQSANMVPVSIFPKHQEKRARNKLLVFIFCSANIIHDFLPSSRAVLGFFFLLSQYCDNSS